MNPVRDNKVMTRSIITLIIKQSEANQRLNYGHLR